MGEKFAANPVTGTGHVSVPLAASSGRGGFGPQLSLSYDSGSGNGPFGFGWSLSLPSITRKTSRGLPRYFDADESDVFLLSGAEDLVPVFRKDAGGAYLKDEQGRFVVFETRRDGYTIRRYRPRIEGLFAVLERWTRDEDGDVHWRSLSRDNVLTVFGRDAGSRILDPMEPSHIFSWLVSETRDDRGNVIVYEYRAEDGTGVDLSRTHQGNRGGRQDPRRSANRYLKRVRYGNRVPLLDEEGQRPEMLSRARIDATDWMFEVVLDYGDHDAAAPTPHDDEAVDAAGALRYPWAARPDAFSSYRAGFEVRTHRLCRCVLMFHHFPDEASIGADCLVRSTNLTYSPDLDPADARNPVYSFLMSVQQTGYMRAAEGGYQAQAMPPLQFEYSRPQVQDGVEELDLESLQNLPAGLDDVLYHWIDLHGEGLPGILTEQGDDWYYKRNLSPLPTDSGPGAGPVKARFAPVESVAVKPNCTLRGAQFMDLSGAGRADLVVLEGPEAGFYEHDDAEGWKAFRPLAARLNYDWDDPNLRLVDLDGDGIPDVLITGDEVFFWHPSLEEQGFGPARRVQQSHDEELGPRLVFSDASRSIYLADMSGDGLMDLVRVRNGEVSYWPNLGYGRFGARIAMDNAPWFDHPDVFDQRRIRLADIDGSGTTDLLYLHQDGVRLYFNQSGNGWSQPQRLNVFPRIDDLASILPVDLLGNGTACLVWSSSLPADGRRPMRYVDLMGGQKPHLLIKTVNNLGAETQVHYAPSTRFYLQDRRDGNPWVCKLPFPVHVVEKVEVFDFVARTRFASRYVYHHGYFDGEEREFRGFGMVEQQDTEAFEDYVVGVERIEGTQTLAPELNQPPVTTRTWYHLGAYPFQDRLEDRYRQEYYQQLRFLDAPVLPADLSADDWSEGLRALKGTPLRQEVYSFDGSDQALRPFTIVEHTFELRRVQPRGLQRHGVYLVVGRESIALNLERNPADPRITHSFGLDLDEYGNARRSCSVVYGRQVSDPLLPAEVRQDQQRLYITCGETDYTPDIERSLPVPAYRLRVPCESRSFEITGISPASSRFQFDEIRDAIAGATVIAYEVMADGLTAQKRLLTRSCVLFLDNALSPLPPGQWDSLGLGHRGFQLAITAEIAAGHFAGNVSTAELEAAGYTHFNGDAHWWIPTGTAIYPADPAAHFYVPIGTRDPLGVETVATFDPYDLLVERVEIVQAAWSVVRAVNDYRILGPLIVTDPNQNRSAVEVDALGLVVKTALMGKAGAGEGDTLLEPTTRMEYDLFNWMNNRKPNFVHAFARERHGAANPRWQESYTWFNGSGGVAMVKSQAHPGKAFTVDAEGNRVEVDADPRWVGNGRTLLNNKGNPVKQYEPYFSTTHEYEDEEALRELGATPVLYYDAVGRNVRTLLPNGTFTRIEFNPWMQRVFDANDTVLQSRWYVERGSPDPTSLEPVGDPERRAAWLAAKHADTPATVHFDSLGRPVYAVADYGGGKTAAVRSESDLTGRFSRVFDQMLREVASGFAGPGGIPIFNESAEKGRRYAFSNVMGALIKSWDEHGRRFRVDYDVLHRPISTFVREPGQDELLFNYVVYGDRLATAEQHNLLGVPHQIFDQAGMMRVPDLDFKGNPIQVERLLARHYTGPLDWSVLAAQVDYAAIQTAANPALETGEVFTARSEFDALNRPTRVTLPDNTELEPLYNEANFLASLRARIRGQGSFIEFLKDQDYDAKGQRQFAQHGNDVFLRYFYDPQTFRLTHLLTYRSGADPETQGLQNLHYTFDPVGNITQVRDDAQPTHYFSNAVIRPEHLYEYDALYQLIRATGREHAGSGNNDIRTDADLEAIPQLPHINSPDAVRNYTEEYEYDLLGNLKVFRHRFPFQAGVGNGWTRHYRYAFDIDPTDRTNRLRFTRQPGDAEAGPFTGAYTHDAYGNMRSMPHLSTLDWNFMDQLRRVDLGGGGNAYYVYGVGGERLRKVIERSGDLKLEWIFLGAVTIFRRRRRDTNELRLERWTVRIGDDTGPIAQVDTKTSDADGTDPANPLNVPLIRYCYTNHLGSATLETDDDGNPISYEEYHPFGTTAYRSSRPGFDLSLKRYRFSGKERDDETGLYYFGARYYAPWLGRWTSSDPAGFVDGPNLYAYCSNNPVCMRDPTGTDGESVVIVTGKVVDENIQVNSDAARARLEAYYRSTAFADPNNPDLYWQYVPGTLHWDAARGRNWGTFSPVEAITVTATPSRPPANGSSGATAPAPEASSSSNSSGPAAPPNSATNPQRDDHGSPHGNIASAATTHDAYQRGRYENSNHAASRASQEVIEGAAREGNGVRAWEEARSASEARNARRVATQQRLTPPGRMLSEAIEGERNFPRMVRTYSTRVPGVEGGTASRTRYAFEIARRIAVASGESRPLMRNLGRAGRVLGPIGVGVSVYGLEQDLEHGDYSMATGDALTVAGGGMELYALAVPGATIAGASALTLGLAVGGAGLAVTSGISGYRAYKQGDTAGAVAGGVGVVAGAAITAGAGIMLASAAGIAVGAGAVAAAPVLIAAGLVAAVGLGIFHAGRYFKWW